MQEAFRGDIVTVAIGAVVATAAIAMSGALDVESGRASRADGPTELPDLRTAVSSTVRNGDGSFTTTLNQDRVHFRDGQGEWQPVSSELVASTKDGYAFENEANDFKVRFAQGQKAVAEIELPSGHAFDLSVDADVAVVPRKHIKGIEIPGIAEDATLQYELSGTGLKESIVIASTAAPTSYRFVLEPRGNEEWNVVELERGAFALHPVSDASDRLVLEPPIVADSRPGLPIDPNDITGPAAVAMPIPLDRLDPPAPDGTDALNLAPGKSSMTVKKVGRVFVIELSVDAKWLADPERVFPVVLDPTFNLSSATDGFTDTWNSSTTINMSTSLYAGRSRGLVQFDLGGLPPGASVTSAAMELWWKGCAPDGCPWFPLGDVTLAAKRVTSAWNSSSTDATVSVNSGTEASRTYYSGWQTTPSGPPYWTSYSLTSLVQGWMAGTYPNYGVSLHATGWNNCQSSPTYAGWCDVVLGSIRDGGAFSPKLYVTWDSDAVVLQQPTSLHGNGADLSWERYTGSYSSSDFVSYEVHRSPSASFTASATTLIATINDRAITRYRDTTAAAGTAFSYKVVSISDSSTSPINPSNEVRVTLPASGTSTVTIQPGPSDGQDTTIQTGCTDVSNPSGLCYNEVPRTQINSGASTTMSIGGWPGEKFRSLLKFDLRGIPSSATITAAAVALYVAPDSSSPPVTLHANTADWTEGTGTGCWDSYGCAGVSTGADWNERTPATAWATVGGDFGSSLASSSYSSGWTEFSSSTLTSTLNSWIHGGSVNHGFLLKRNDEDSHSESQGVKWYSSDTTLNAAIRPKLTVTYSNDAAVAVAPTVAVSSSAVGAFASGSVTLAAAAFDDRRIDSVKFYDGVTQIGSTDTAAPFSVVWDTTSVSGARSITAVAADDAGNTTTSAVLGLTVANSNPPTAAIASITSEGYRDAVLRDGGGLSDSLCK